MTDQITRPDVSALVNAVARGPAAASAMMPVLNMHEEHVRTLSDVLRALLPKDARVYVFGSRVSGGARRYSDLDLALQWSRPLGLDVLGEIGEALSGSELPYKVDIVDLATVTPGFRASSAGNWLPFEITDRGG